MTSALAPALVRWLCAYCAAVTITYAASSVIVPPGMFSDPGFGFLAWQSMLDGGPFNSIVAPDPDDLARDREAACRLLGRTADRRASGMAPAGT